MISICKVCGSDAPLHGLVDFNKSCEVNRGMYLPLTGDPVWYYRCFACGFLFTRQFDNFTIEDWKREVYNEGYDAIDPDGANGERARHNAELVSNYAHYIGTTSILDFGGGNGALARNLVSMGFDAVSWDPMSGAELPSMRFGLVCSFEVFEHATDPCKVVSDIKGLVADGGRLLFSTLTIDQLPPYSMDHWYVSPRNGHVSIHTRESLSRMFGKFGWRVEHLSDAFHVAGV